MSARVKVPTVFATPSEACLARRLKTGKYLRSECGLEKRCSKCRRYWPADNVAYYTTKADSDGLYHTCKACWREWFDHRKTAKIPLLTSVWR